MALPITVYVGGSGLILAVLLAYLYEWYTARKKMKQRVQDLYQEIAFDVDQRQLRHPKLIEHKLNAAEQAVNQKQYTRAVRILEDTRSVIRLS